MKKNKIYNPVTLKKQLDPIFFDELTRKINKAKLMKFITAEPERFHLYLVTKFYRKTVVATDSKSFRTNVYGTCFNITSKNTKGRINIVQRCPRSLPKLVKDKGKKKTDAGKN